MVSAYKYHHDVRFSDQPVMFFLSSSRITSPIGTSDPKQGVHYYSGSVPLFSVIVSWGHQSHSLVNVGVDGGNAPLSVVFPYVMAFLYKRDFRGRKNVFLPCSSVLLLFPFKSELPYGAKMEEVR